MSADRQQTLLIYFLSAIFVVLVLISCNKGGVHAAAIPKAVAAQVMEDQALNEVTVLMKVNSFVNTGFAYTDADTVINKVFPQPKF